MLLLFWGWIVHIHMIPILIHRKWWAVNYFHVGSGDATDAKPRSRSMSSMSPPGAATKVCYFEQLHYNQLDGAHWYYWTIKVYQSKTTPGAHLGRYSHCLCHTSRLHLKQVINYRSKMTKGSIQIMQQHDAIYHCNNFYSSWTRDHFRGTWFIESLSKVYSIELGCT